MRTVIKQSLTGLSLLLVMLTGCQEQTNTTSLLNESKTGSGQIYQVDQEGGQGDFVYTHDIGSSPRDVYFILTNIGLSDISSPTSITANQSSNHALSLEPLVPENEANLDEFDLVEYAKKHGIGLRGIPGINDLIIDPSQLDLATINKSMRPLSQSVSFAIVGQTDSLFAIKNNSTIY
ncbi:hypothetical protein KKA14_21630, partial [bacterium]|nr:hypothetical protein [bacterium]